MAQKLTLILGSKNYSSWSLRGWLALEQTGAPFDEVFILLDQPDTRANILRHSPSGKVPALIDGERTIWDTLAITEYLHEQFPDAGLWPKDVTARAFARSMCAEMHSGFLALRTNMPMNLRRRAPGVGRAPGVAEDIARITSLWRESRARFGQGGPYLFGTRTVADAFFAPVVSRFTTYAVEVDRDAAAYMDTIWKMPAMQRWAEAARNEPRVEKYE